MSAREQDVKVNAEIIQKNAELFKAAFTRPIGLEGDPYSEKGARHEYWVFNYKPNEKYTQLDNCTFTVDGLVKGALNRESEISHISFGGSSYSPSYIPMLRISLRIGTGAGLHEQLKAKGVPHDFDPGAGSFRSPSLALDCSQNNIDFDELFEVLRKHMPLPIRDQLLRDIYFRSVFIGEWLEFIKNPTKIFDLPSPILNEGVFQTIKTYMKTNKMLYLMGEKLLEMKNRGLQTAKLAVEIFNAVPADDVNYKIAQLEAGKLILELAEAEEKAGQEAVQVENQQFEALAHFLRAGEIGRAEAEKFYTAAELLPLPNKLDIYAVHARVLQTIKEQRDIARCELETLRGHVAGTNEALKIISVMAAGAICAPDCLVDSLSTAPSRAKIESPAIRNPDPVLFSSASGSVSSNAVHPTQAASSNTAANGSAHTPSGSSDVASSAKTVVSASVKW